MSLWPYYKIVECADNSFKLFTEIVRCERITDDVSLSGLYKVIDSADVVVVHPQDILVKCILIHVEGTDNISINQTHLKGANFYFNFYFLTSMTKSEPTQVS